MSKTNWQIINQYGYYCDNRIKWMNEDDVKRFLEEVAHYGAASLDELIYDIIDYDEYDMIDYYEFDEYISPLEKLYHYMNYASNDAYDALTYYQNDPDKMKEISDIIGEYDLHGTHDILFRNFSGTVEENDKLIKLVETYLFNSFAKFYREQLVIKENEEIHRKQMEGVFKALENL